MNSDEIDSAITKCQAEISLIQQAIAKLTAAEMDHSDAIVKSNAALIEGCNKESLEHAHANLLDRWKQIVQIRQEKAELSASLTPIIERLHEFQLSAFSCES